jgi:hypothetical protein
MPPPLASLFLEQSELHEAQPARFHWAQNATGIEALSEMMAHDAQTACGPRHVRGPNRQAHRWGKK